MIEVHVMKNQQETNYEQKIIKFISSYDAYRSPDAVKIKVINIFA